jgi:hypothetical protein
MKTLQTLALLFSALVGTVTVHSQTISTKTKTAEPSKFGGKWKGTEMCSQVSAPVALLFVSGTGSQVSLSGLYSLQGTVKATTKGDTLVIPQQEVKDPNFKNLVIEGKLAYGVNPTSLTGKISVLNNQLKDDCAVKYYK